MEKSINGKNEVVWYLASGSMFFGLMLVLIGLYYVAKYLGWIAQDFPFWPSVLIFLGVIVIFGSVRKVVRQY